MRIVIIATMLFLISVDGDALATNEAGTIEIEAEGGYRMGTDASVEKTCRGFGREIPFTQKPYQNL